MTENFSLPNEEKDEDIKLIVKTHYIILVWPILKIALGLILEYFIYKIYL